MANSVHVTRIDDLQTAFPRGAGPYACPCCHLLTLDVRGDFEICEECGWEDDGQGDRDADVVRGGPNGPESLTAARIRYQESVAAEQHLTAETRVELE